jgi:hypothetical protein
MGGGAQGRICDFLIRPVYPPMVLPGFGTTRRSAGVVSRTPCL